MGERGWGGDGGRVGRGRGGEREGEGEREGGERGRVGREGGGGGGGMTVIHIVIGMFTSNPMIPRGRNKPKLPLVRRISDMLQTTCPPTCPLVHFVGPKLDALDRQNSGQCKG